MSASDSSSRPSRTPPSPDLIADVAVALGVDEGFVEKDWHVVQVLSGLAGLVHGEWRPAFGGGTSLSKAYGAIQRFSEDIDFKIAPVAGHGSVGKDLNRSGRRAIRNSVISTLDLIGYPIDGEKTVVRDESSFFEVRIPFTPTFPHKGLRPDIKLEMTLAEPAVETEAMAVSSFVATFTRSDPEVAAIECVSRLETAAEKLSALCWRIPEHHGREDRDPTIIRHLHDIAILGPDVAGDATLQRLLKTCLARDSSRGSERGANRPKAPDELFELTCALLTNEIYRMDYEHFVHNASYHQDPIGFDEALASLRRLTGSFSNQLS